MRQVVLIYRTLADKAREDILKSSAARYCPTRPDLVVDLSEFIHTSRQLSGDSLFTVEESARECQADGPTSFDSIKSLLFYDEKSASVWRLKIYSGTTHTCISFEIMCNEAEAVCKLLTLKLLRLCYLF